MPTPLNPQIEAAARALRDLPCEMSAPFGWTEFKRRNAARAKRAVTLGWTAVAAAAAIAAVGIGLWRGASPPPQSNAAAIPSQSQSEGYAQIVWEPWSRERVAQLATAGRPIYVSFTARWCATCRANNQQVFGSKEVLRTFREQRVVLLRADWTDRNPRIGAELARYRRASVPLNLVYLPGRTEPQVLPERLTPEVVLAAMGR